VATLAQIWEALGEQIHDELCGTANMPIPDLQVVPIGPFPDPSAPSIDIYPAEQFQLPLAMGGGNNIIYVDVRARVGTPDDEAGKRLLLSMMDPEADTSVGQAIVSDRKLGGVVGNVSISAGPTGFGTFEGTGREGSLLGCIWTVRIIR
jgi:hypothetical protein